MATSSIKLKLEKYQDELPYMSAKADAIIREAEMLDYRADKEVNSLKESRYRSQAAAKRLQAAKITSEIEARLNDLEAFGSIIGYKK